MFGDEEYIGSGVMFAASFRTVAKANEGQPLAANSRGVIHPRPADVTTWADRALVYFGDAISNTVDSPPGCELVKFCNKNY